QSSQTPPELAAKRILPRDREDVRSHPVTRGRRDEEDPEVRDMTCEQRAERREVRRPAESHPPAQFGVTPCPGGPPENPGRDPDEHAHPRGMPGPGREGVDEPAERGGRRRACRWGAEWRPAQHHRPTSSRNRLSRDTPTRCESWASRRWWERAKPRASPAR